MGACSYMDITNETDFLKPIYECSQNSLPKIFFLANAREDILAISLISCKGTCQARFIGNFQGITAISSNLCIFKSCNYWRRKLKINLSPSLRYKRIEKLYKRKDQKQSYKC